MDVYLHNAVFIKYILGIYYFVKSFLQSTYEFIWICKQKKPISKHKYTRILMIV